VETRYLLDEGMTANVWEEYGQGESVQGSYSYGYDLITQTQAGQASYYLVDGLGSTRLLLDGQGLVLNSYGYEAFGETVSQTGTTGNKYQYAGEQLDSALGDYYLRQRFYDTSSGRFGRMDTYEGNRQQPLSLSKYIYTQDDPINGVDPTGYFLMGALSVIVTLSALAGLYFITQTTPYFTADASKGLTYSEGYQVEQRVLQYSRTLASQEPDGSAAQFAMLMSYTARLINPVRWVQDRRLRSDYLKIAYDMFTQHEHKDDSPIFGFLGNAGPRSQGRPRWLTVHEDNPQGWRDYYPNDKEESRKLNYITGRRDHFLTNALVGFPSANLIENFVLHEGSDNDRMTNALGRSFGISIAHNLIPQFGIESWINSNM
jgi:RHS repeat-associated protein